MEKNPGSWFEVDKHGLAKVLARKGKAFIIHELVQNAWDTRAAKVEVWMTKSAAVDGCYVIDVHDDDPDGFKDLRHSFTLFAESEKKGDAEKRGRFNLGEKLVLAMCKSAEITTTTGRVVFAEGTGRREDPETRTEKGSRFIGVVPMTDEEAAEIAAAARALLPPTTTKTLFNGHRIPVRGQRGSFRANLPTEVAGEDGVMKQVHRATYVKVFRCEEGETPHLYEMGIPVVPLEGGERWHVNVQQKVPLNMERDNVTPAFLKKIRIGLAETVVKELGPEDADQAWLNEALESKDVHEDVVKKALDLRFGERRAIFDMTDRESNKQLINEGYAVITGGSLTRLQWENVRRTGAALPSGQVRPSGVQSDPEGRPESLVLPKEYSTGMTTLVRWMKDVGRALLEKKIDVRVVREPVARPHAAWYGGSTLTLNLGKLGWKWFHAPVQPKHAELLVHELAHDAVSDHLTREFSDEVGRLAVKLAFMAAEHPAMVGKPCRSWM